VDLLAVLQQNPEADWRALLGSVDVAEDRGELLEQEIITVEGDPDDELATLRL